MYKMKQVIQEFLSLEGSLFRYSLSYCFLLALLPGVIVSVLLFQYSILGVSDLLRFLYYFVPEDLIAPFVDFIMDKQYTSLFALLVASIVPCFIASKSFYSFMLISAKKESFHTSKMLIRMKSYLLFFLFIAEIVGLAIVTHLLHLHTTISFGVGLIVIFWLFYRSLSFERRPLRYGLVGSLFSSAAILLIAYAFLYVVNFFTSYKSMYGPLASLVILFLAVYVISCVVYFGYCLNVNFQTSKANKTYKSEWYYRNGEKFIQNIKKVFLKG